MHRENLLNVIFLAEAFHTLDVLDLHAFLSRQPLGVSESHRGMRRELLRVIEQADVRRSSSVAIACGCDAR